MSADDPRAEQARIWADVASDGFATSAAYFQSLPEDAWSGPTGAEKWTMRDLAGHIVGEAVWFPNLIRVATRGDAPIPGERYEELNRLPPAEIADITTRAAADIRTAVQEAIPEHLETPLDLGFAQLPLWQATAVSAMEGALHDWDTRARREPHPTLRPEWADALSGVFTDMAGMLVHRDNLPGAQGTYLLQVGDPVGPITITVGGNELSITRGAEGQPDVTIHLTPDQYVRLIAGRCPLDANQEIKVEGNREEATGLNRVFAGIANE